MSSDPLGIPPVDLRSCASLKKQFGLERAQIMLNASHSHCTPVLRNALYDAYPLPESQKEIINRYSDQLEVKIVETVGRALASLTPARLASGQGVTRFSVNRRNNLESAVPKLRDANGLKGPGDHRGRTGAGTDGDGGRKAGVFGYAGHNTWLSN